MSHIFLGKSCRIYYNSDLSGHITIRQEDDMVNIEAEDLFVFLGEWLKGRAIADLEKTNPKDFLRRRAGSYGSF